MAMEVNHQSEQNFIGLVLYVRNTIAETPSMSWRIAGVVAGFRPATEKPIERLIQHVSRDFALSCVRSRQ